jgi:hypothetical protein
LLPHFYPPGSVGGDRTLPVYLLVPVTGEESAGGAAFDPKELRVGGHPIHPHIRMIRKTRIGLVGHLHEHEVRVGVHRHHLGAFAADEANEHTDSERSPAWGENLLARHESLLSI